MATTKSRLLKIAFLLDEQLFLRIISVLKEISEEIDYRIYCSDGSSFQPSSTEEVLNFPNIKERQITSISLNTPWGQEPRVQIRFRAESLISPGHQFNN